MALSEQKKKQKQLMNLLLNKHYKIMVGVIFGVVILAGGWFLIYPKYSSIRQTAASSLPGKIEELKALEDYASKIKELETAIANWQLSNQSKVKTLEQILPDQPRVPELMAQLDALARGNGFSVKSMAFSEGQVGPALRGATGSSVGAVKRGAAAKKDAAAALNLNLDKNIRLVNINLNLSGGDYLAFKKFLDAVEKNMRLLDVVSIDFSGSSGKGADYNVALRTYYLSEEPAVGVALPPVSETNVNNNEND